MLEIVEYNDTYKEEVPKLILEVYENELGFVGYERPDIFDIPNYYNKDKGSNFWVAIDNGMLVGTVGLLHKNNGLAYLKRMILDRKYRKQGIGKELLQTAIIYARKKGHHKMYAGTVKENPNAIQFYLSQGFVETSDVPDDITAATNSICLEYIL